VIDEGTAAHPESLRDATTRNSVPRNCREPDMTLVEEDETQTPSSRDDERHPATGQAA